MNFLAHAFLAGDDAAYRAGGVIGDFIKGPLPAGLPEDLAAGVALHRALDSYADRHPAFIASRTRITPERRRVGGVLVDLFYDHLLARDWARHGVGPLAAYAADVYATLDAYADFLPEAAREVAQLMRQHDWLVSYGRVEAVARTIDRMARYRLRQPNHLGGGIEEFLADAEGFAADFRTFLPDASRFCAEWRSRRAV
ncbi:acyl carrier protein phosphodiesterase [Propionivibrio soli]|uniref:acyl carrier protein phosphodiesterase n=1 Tax=Propionivibrio soli TaxID=2976531 RepID=UPI0021E98DFA|nr:acyl carrier protein phosphodiesterase [Propionivibrio soli]